MNRILCFATGCLWRLCDKKNRANLIKYAQRVEKFGIRGVELTIAKKEELYKTKLSPEQTKWLRSLDYVSIHAPFRLLRRADNLEEVIKQLDCIDRIYRKTNARMVIIHPLDLPPKRLLDRYDMNFSTENLPKKRHVTIPMLKKIFKEYPKLGLCLDVAHAYLWSRFETERLVRDFKSKITQIHLSGTYKGRDHLSLQQVTPIFLKSIKSIKELKVPIIIEEDIKNKNMQFIEKEINHIKSII